MAQCYMRFFFCSRFKTKDSDDGKFSKSIARFDFYDSDSWKVKHHKNAISFSIEFKVLPVFYAAPVAAPFKAFRNKNFVA